MKDQHSGLHERPRRNRTTASEENHRLQSIQKNFDLLRRIRSRVDGTKKGQKRRSNGTEKKPGEEPAKRFNGNTSSRRQKPAKITLRELLLPGVKARSIGNHNWKIRRWKTKTVDEISSSERFKGDKKKRNRENNSLSLKREKPTHFYFFYKNCIHLILPEQNLPVYKLKY